MEDAITRSVNGTASNLLADGTVVLTGTWKMFVTTDNQSAGHAVAL